VLLPNTPAASGNSGPAMANTARDTGSTTMSPAPGNTAMKGSDSFSSFASAGVKSTTPQILAESATNRTSITNLTATTTETKPTEEDPVMFFISQGAAGLREGLLRKSAWWLYALLLVFIGALVTRRWLTRGKRIRPVHMEEEE
jgi:hypothetical protein